MIQAPTLERRRRFLRPAAALLAALDAARSVGLQCSEVVVKVAATALEPAPPAMRRPIPLSAATREALEAALASLKDGS